MANLYVLSRSSSIDDIRYVGITAHKDVEKRLKAHLEKSRTGVNRPVYDWMRKYDDIVITKVEGNLSWDDACAKEIKLISDLKSAGCRLLNMTNGGDGSLGRLQSQETKLKRSKSLLGHIVSEDTRKRISESKMGHKHSEKARENMSKAHKGKKLTESHRKNIGKSITGRKYSPETLQKMSNSQKGKTLSATHIENIKTAQRKRRERERKEKGINND